MSDEQMAKYRDLIRQAEAEPAYWKGVVEAADALIAALTAQLADAEQAIEVRSAELARYMMALNAATQREGALREALEGIMNYADDPPCESSLTGECDKGYHNDHGQAIVRARAALLTSPPGYTLRDAIAAQEGDDED